MISSIVFIILQIMNLVNTDNLNALWKIYIPVCIIEMVVYFRFLFKWSEK